MNKLITILLFSSILHSKISKSYGPIDIQENIDTPTLYVLKLESSKVLPNFQGQIPNPKQYNNPLDNSIEVLEKQVVKSIYVPTHKIKLKQVDGTTFEVIE
tara:strand:+ start:319 stop:621 length:303 start_codon:yes stop_codon:yes gene_type:complete